MNRCQEFSKMGHSKKFVVKITRHKVSQFAAMNHSIRRVSFDDDQKLESPNLRRDPTNNSNFVPTKDKKKQTRKRRRRRMRIFLLVICSVGLLYHLIVTTINYLSYEMVTTISIFSPDVIEPPAISMCLELKDFKQLPKNCTIDAEDEYKNCLINQYSLNDLMNRYSGNLSKSLLFRDLHTRRVHAENETGNLYYQSKTSQYYFSDHKCIKVPAWLGKDNILNRTSETVDNKINRSFLEHGLDNMFLLDFYLNVNKSTDNYNSSCIYVTLFFHDHDKIGHDLESNVVRYYFQPGVEPNVARLSYHQITTNYRMYPFEHNCYDYSENPILESRGECHEQCMKSGILQKYGKVGRVVSTTLYDDDIPFDAPIRDDAVNDKCNIKCPIGCRTVQYNPILAFLWTSTTKNHTFGVQLLANYPQTFIIYRAKFDLLSYLIYLGGIFGLWIGLDLLSLSSALIDNLIFLLSKARLEFRK